MKIEEIKDMIISSFHEKNNSHAFLLSTNNIDKALNDVLDIVKKVNCLGDGNDSCNVCTTIDSSTNPDVIVVRAEGKEIKKDQILNIISSFSTKPSISKYSTYIICNADKMNDFSANKMLKFLEEPEGNIVGFFITDKLNGIIPTIRSRCEIYNYHFGNNSILDLLDINEEEYALAYDLALKLTIRLNDEPKYSLMADSKTISKRERDEIDLLFKLIKKFYVLKYENIQLNMYNDLEYVENILDSITTTDLSIIVKRIKILDNIINEMNIYVNRDLIVNKFFILWE
ncbi:MAG: hypothetical protein HFI73_05935 [Bacilli bacterium]|jgi:hypothetical protein|nr:hypothetical protein [Bacilli bacterium]